MKSISGSRLEASATLNCLDVEVSYYAHKADKKPTRRNLFDLLNDNSRMKEIEQVRTILKEKGIAAYATEKIKQPAFIVSVKCKNGHSKECIVSYTGLLSFDIDSKENPSWTTDEMKACLACCENIAYCGLSLSGNGVFGIIPIAFPEKHIEHFNALKQAFNIVGQRWKGVPLVIDKSCGNPNRLRFCSYDLNPVWQTDADLFKLTYEPEPNDTLKQASKPLTNPETETILRWCTKLIDEATDGQKHQQLFRASLLAGGYIAGGVLSEEVAIARLEYAVSQKPNVADYMAAQRTIRDGIAKGKLKPIYQQPLIEPQPQQEKELQAERLSIEPCNNYPADWDKPDPPGAKPTIKVKSFHEWQQQNPPFNTMGIASLKHYKQYEKGK